MKNQMEFLLKDISGRGYTSNLSQDEMKKMFRGYLTVDKDRVVDELLNLDIGDTYDLGDNCISDNFNATVIIRTK
jgi:hypothetical protein